jgi:hypothetical protein
VHALSIAGAAFLLSVLWLDLMFDVQVWSHRRGDVPEPVLASVAAYYRRVTTDARPMNRLVALAMLVTIVAVVVEAVRETDPAWAGWLAVALVVVPVGIAGSRTVPSAVRLGSRRDPYETQAALAQAILVQHLVCFASIASVLALQLATS